ncbi:HEAT repeat-containing protein 1 [Amphibalanus amphitrite]|uniref:HEAT repeat-containing protein 1 n=1 Tax=Amphibalanus amphitrite TaxID=1232801 RepID=A0A6A4X6B0_AMPAM|nr:HEAT repeat-containing protein 1 [Amphibalanus amphitrite]
MGCLNTAARPILPHPGWRRCRALSVRLRAVGPGPAEGSVCLCADRSAPAADPTLAADEADVTGRVWRRRRLLLEALAARRRPGDEALLVGALLALLRRLLCVADQPGAEYLTQLGLSCVQQACGHLLRQGRPPATFSVDTLVQCVRRSPSPHTQQLALTVLGQAARIVPETVLHNTMAVFTFMGSSMLRQDTEYSFDVIQRTVENVVPALVQVGTDVPRHRRLPLFAHLLRTAGERRHLGLCLAMISDQLATRGDLGDQLAEHTVLAAGDRGAPLLVDFAVSLCGQFAVDVQLESCCQLISHSEALLLRHHESAGRAPDTGGGDGPALFDLDAYSEKQLHRHCHTAISVVAHLLASETFVVQSAALDAAGAAAARQRHQQLLEGAIRLMGVCSRLCHSALAGRPQATRHLRAILHRLYDLLDKVNALLPWATLLPVVSALMASDLAAVRRRAMDLLASRLQLQHDGFSESDVPALLAITDELVAAAGAESEDGSALSRQTALFAVKLLSRRLSADQPRHFVQVSGLRGRAPPTASSRKLHRLADRFKPFKGR